MDVDQLKPLEIVKERVQCEYPKSKVIQDGLMVITNVRVLWKPQGMASFPIQILRTQPNSNQRLKVMRSSRLDEDKKPLYWAIKVEEPPMKGEKKGKSYIFRFESKSAETDSMRVLNELKQIEEDSDMLVKIQFLGPEALSKLSLLHGKEELRDEFSSLVIARGDGEVVEASQRQDETWEEGEFWQIFGDEVVGQ